MIDFVHSYFYRLNNLVHKMLFSNTIMRSFYASASKLSNIINKTASK